MTNRIFYDTSNVASRDFAMPVEETISDYEDGDEMSDELTVESCLKELREMFRGKPIFIRQDSDFYPEDCRDGAETVRTVTIKIGYLESEPKFRSRTLNEAMSQVRAFKQSQEQER